jgi:hypothetical protein
MSAIDPLVRISLPLLNPRGRPHRTLAVAPRRPASLQCSAAYPSDTSPAVFVRLRGVPINRAAGEGRAAQSRILFDRASTLPRDISRVRRAIVSPKTQRLTRSSLTATKPAWHAYVFSFANATIAVPVTRSPCLARGTVRLGSSLVHGYLATLATIALRVTSGFRTEPVLRLSRSSLATRLRFCC